MLTENRSSNTEMVSVQATIESLEEAYAGDGALDFMNDAAQLLRQFKAISALELQGEPVVPKLKKPRYTPTPCRFGGKDGYYQVGGVLVYDSLAEAQASADRKNAELAQRYYEALEHADPGEVDRLREVEDAYKALEEMVQITAKAVGDNTGTMWVKIQTAFLRDMPRLRAQLAEARNLLDTASITLARWLNMSDEPRRQIISFLEASAEPSAPIAWHVGGNGYDRICFEKPAELPGSPCIQAIHDQHQLIDLLKRYDLRDEEVPLDERSHGIPGTSFQRLNALANQGE
ncbi:hypothetical protein ACNFG0_09755 [Pseudomonas sp. NY15372]|uniref:hypothetical protein n=1 Tax=Pseudomonas sp. NY15372 TaxID=3400356 RepID=UPI003A86EFA3